MKKCSDPLHLSVWAGGYSFSLKQDRSKIPRCGPALFSFMELAKQGDKRFHEGFSKQAQLLCQNCISSAWLLKLEDCVPWSQYLHPSSLSESKCDHFHDVNVDILVLLSKDTVFFYQDFLMSDAGLKPSPR